ncbi:MAG: efflux RND transporter permease subunit [Gammaproteobacteria bacterium]|nr:efflux RND transporter permease subunit [Gammaproteobacteria bacterium]MBU2058252.1 efflux RND transporter permease subunit [Gammaproteobacteria bacterium]MBU2176434.1 efflux RND transporter permease subunit [Gammaproteobacteria bacterium]MBU2246393.1 efflux RND transporter permease subunit [Gammaproteobacteria bacterium]MBU2342869.1 efflux RND transporter permease subunit [Gammaproteobacteria bacterium]
MKLVDIAVARPVTMWMFTLGIMLFGLVAMGRLAVNLLPDLSYPTLTIRTEYQGAAPAEVEQLVSKPIEEAVGIVKGIRKVHSVSRAGRSDVIMEFEWGSDMDLAGLEVREKIDVLYLPLDVKKPLLLRFNPNLDPVVRLALSRDEKTELTPAQLVSLRTFAEEDLRRRLESLPGVAAVRPDGGLTQEIQILVNNEKLSQLKLDINTVNQRLKEQNINQAGGRLETGSHDYLVRTINQFSNLDEIRNLYIAKVGESQIRLSDIAEVRDSFVDRQSITYVHGKEAIEISIYKEGDANTVQVAKTVTAKLADLQKNLPAGYQLTLVYDQSTFIKQAIDEVKSAAFAGGILAMLVLYLFLRNVWTTLVISVSIPLSVIATFNLMYAQDISLNIMSLGGIALAIGMLVDNAIVVLENIARYKEQGMAPMEAAKKGASEVSMAITASTLTTVAVFFPLVFVEGVAGQLFKDQALTVTYALLASLLVALTLIPAMAARERTGSASASALASAGETSKITIKPSRWYLWPLVPFHLLYLAVRFLFLGLFTLLTILFRLVAKALSFVFKPLLHLVQAFLAALESGYRVVLTAALKVKALVVAATLGITALIYSLIPGLGFDVIPSMSQGEFYVEVQLPVGSAIERTDRVLKQLAAVASLQPEIDRSYAQAGTGQQMTVDPNVGGSHWGRLNIILKDSATTADEERLIQLFRDSVSSMPDLTAKIDRPELFSFSTPMEIELSGHDLSSLKATSDQLAKLLAANNRFTDIKSSLRSGQPELTLHFHHDRLSQLGLTAADVSRRVANYIGGEVAGQYSINDRKVDIRVRLAENFRNSEQQLSQIIINPNSQNPLPLSAVADIKREIGPSEITRIGQQRVALVSANLAYGDLEQGTAAAKAVLAELTLPYGVGATIVGQSEEMERSFNSLMMALLLAVFLVYLVMASQFENLLQPLLILFTVPLAGAGAVLGLWLTGTRVSVIVFIGLIMLAGIVVNNAIVLIDRINQLRAEGAPINDAIVQAGATRLRPVLMTTLTTVLGLLPMVLGSSDGAEIRSPMAITVIWGLSLSTLLTLVFIPVLYRLTAPDVQAAKE